MDIEGTYTLQAPVEEIWQCLKDVQALRHAMPGLERLESTGQLAYAFTLRIKQAPLRGEYTGRAIISTDLSGPPMSCNLVLEGDNQHNPFQGTWNIHLNQQQDNAIVTYSGTLTPGKTNALLPPSLLKGTAKILIQQFFANLAEQLRATPDPLSHLPQFDASETHPSRVRAGLAPALAPRRVRAGLAPALALVPLRNKLRAGLAPAQVTRLKRYGAFSVLLLLVWVGTRLPRRLLPRD